VKDTNALFETMEYMKKNNIDIVGPPDGGLYTIRTEYPVVFNAFFNIIRTRNIKAKPSYLAQISQDWLNMPEEEKFERLNKFHERHISALRYEITNKTNSQGYEPYYAVFMYLQDNHKFEYLFCKDSEEYPDAPATEVYSPNGQLFLIHTWLARFYCETNLCMDLGIHRGSCVNNFERINYFHDKAYCS